MSKAQANNKSVACTLDSAGAADQLSDWAALQVLCTGVQRTPGGVVLCFAGEAESRLRSVVAREAECCQFLDLDVQRDGDFLRLAISSDSPGAEPVIEMLATQASGR